MLTYTVKTVVKINLPRPCTACSVTSQLPEATNTGGQRPSLECLTDVEAVNGILTEVEIIPFEQDEDGADQ